MESLWYKITLNKNQIDEKAEEQVRNTFQRLHTARPDIPHAILMISKFADQTGAVDIYFSPGAAAIGEEQPDRQHRARQPTANDRHGRAGH